MANKIVGYKQNNFVSKTDGTEIKGYTVYLADEEKDGVIGIETTSFYLTEAKVEAFKLDLANAIGKHVYIRYNSYGKPSVVKVIDRE